MAVRVLKCVLGGLYAVLLALLLTLVIMLGRALWLVARGGSDVFGFAGFEIWPVVRSILLIFVTGFIYRWGKTSLR
jgi:chromate transport protein ChrA